MRTREQFLRLRRSELSPLQIGELFGRARVEMQRGCVRALRDAAALRRAPRRAAAAPGRGHARPPDPPGPALAGPEPLQRPVRRAQPAAPAGRRRRQAPVDHRRRPPRRLGRLPLRRRARPSGWARSTCAAPTWPERAGAAGLPGQPAGRPRLGEAALGLQRGALRRRARRRVRVGRVDLPAGQARRPDVRGRYATSDARDRTRSATPACRPARPTRTAFNPSLSADGRIVAFEATDSGQRRPAVAQRPVGLRPRRAAADARRRARRPRRRLPAAGDRRRAGGRLHRRRPADAGHAGARCAASTAPASRCSSRAPTAPRARRPTPTPTSPPSRATGRCRVHEPRAQPRRARLGGRRSRRLGPRPGRRDHAAA